MLYVVIVLGIALWLTLVFQTLVLLQVVRFEGPTHSRVQRWLSFALIAVGAVHAFLAVGTLLLGWF